LKSKSFSPSFTNSSSSSGDLFSEEEYKKLKEKLEASGHDPREIDREVMRGIKSLVDILPQGMNEEEKEAMLVLLEEKAKKFDKHTFERLKNLEADVGEYFQFLIEESGIREISIYTMNVGPSVW
jgi:hypothetical protein